MDVDVVAATLENKPAIRHLLELYAHDFSEFTSADVDDHGRFGYPRLDSYWIEANRHPFIIRAGGRIAGFALVHSGRPHDMAEFFVMRKYRGRGVGVDAARSVFGRFTGDWQTRELATNTPAIGFWRVAIPVPFTESTNDEGPVHSFQIRAVDGVTGSDA